MIGKVDTGLPDKLIFLVALTLGLHQKHELLFQQSRPRSDEYTGFKADLGCLQPPLSIVSQQGQKRSTEQVKDKPLGEVLQPYVHQYSPMQVYTTALG